MSAADPAARAGLRVGDQLLAVDGLSLMALSDGMNGGRAGELLALTVRRGGETRDFVLVLEQPSFSVLLDRLLPIAVGCGFGIIGLSTFLFARCQPPAGLYACLCLIVAGILAAGTLSTFGIPLASRVFWNVSMILRQLWVEFREENIAFLKLVQRALHCSQVLVRVKGRFALRP